MTIQKKIVGGIHYKKNKSGIMYTPQEAFRYFLDNVQEVQVLTDTSISCITLILKIEDDIESPYISSRKSSGVSYTSSMKSSSVELKQILLKVFISGGSDVNKTNGNETKKYVQILHKKEMTTEITSNEELKNEVDIQLDIYTRGYSDKLTYLDPICPAILLCTETLSNGDKEHLLKIIKDKLIKRISKTETITINGIETTINRDDEQLINSFFEYDISLIGMEYLDGFKPIKNYINDVYVYIKLSLYTLFSLLKMYEYGYQHGDFHRGNILANPDYQFFNYTTNYTRDNPYNTGRVMIIDFGRSKKIDTTKYEIMDIKDKIIFICENECKLRNNKGTIINSLLDGTTLKTLIDKSIIDNTTRGILDYVSAQIERLEGIRNDTHRNALGKPHYNEITQSMENFTNINQSGPIFNIEDPHPTRTGFFRNFLTENITGVLRNPFGRRSRRYIENNEENQPELHDIYPQPVECPLPVIHEHQLPEDIARQPDCLSTFTRLLTRRSNRRGGKKVSIRKRGKKINIRKRIKTVTKRK